MAVEKNKYVEYVQNYELAFEGTEKLWQSDCFGLEL